MSSTGCQHVKHGSGTTWKTLLTILLSGSPCQWWTRQQLTAGLIPQQSQLKRSMSPARRPFRATSARTVELAGTNQFQMFATVNTKKFPRGISDSVISNPEARTAAGACTGSGPNPQAPSAKLQAPSVKPQAQRASSDKRQAPSSKRQA